MRKIFNIYDKVAEGLCSFTSDKYVHLIIGLLISYIVSVVVFKSINEEIILRAAVGRAAAGGFISSSLIGFFKEIIDLIRDKGFDIKDLLTTMTGGLLGSLLLILLAI